MRLAPDHDDFRMPGHPGPRRREYQHRDSLEERERIEREARVAAHAERVERELKRLERERYA